MLGIFIEMESRQAVYILKCIGRLNQARAGHSEVFTKMTEENPLLLAPSNKPNQRTFLEEDFQ
jgi:hypothetical protein